MKFKFLKVVITFITLGLSHLATAGVIKYTSDITWDQTNDKDWLDLTLTAGWTNEAIKNALEDDGALAGQGWHWANAQEVASLFVSAAGKGLTWNPSISSTYYDGIIDTSVTADKDLLSPLAALLGFTYDHTDNPSARYSGTKGRIVDLLPTSNFIRLGMSLDITTLMGNGNVLGSFSSGYYRTGSDGKLSDPEAGAWLTRDHIAGTPSAEVPEPSTLAIFALGMFGLVSRRFKK